MDSSLKLGSLFGVLSISVPHYIGDLKTDPNLEDYPHVLRFIRVRGLGSRVYGFMRVLGLSSEVALGLKGTGGA